MSFRCTGSFVLLLVACSAQAASWTTRAAPLSFERNAGQAEASAQFVARSSCYRVLLSAGEVTVARRGPLRAVITMKFAGSRPGTWEGLDQLPGVASYFLGRDPEKWRRGIATYERVRRGGVYPGVDVVFYGAEGQLEYDLVLAPGADISKVALAFDGVRQIRIDADEDLVLESAAGNLVQRKPRVYQQKVGEQRLLDGHYKLKNEREVAFVIPEYDRSRPLVIDPVLVYSTSVSGHGVDQVNGIATDKEGNVYITGSTTSLDFPQTHVGLSEFVQLLYRLDNGGASNVALSGLPGSAVNSVAADPTNTATAYADTNAGLFKTTDAGAHWQPIDGGLPAGAFAGPLLVDPTNTAVLYAPVSMVAELPLAVTTVTQWLGVYKSVDSGLTWHAINNGLGQNPAILSLALDPRQASHLFVGTEGGYFRSVDGGATWTPSGFRYRFLAFDPSTAGTVYAVDFDEKLYRSTDGGNTWQVRSSLSPGYATAIAVDPFNPKTLYAGTQAGVQKSTDGGFTWSYDNFNDANISQIVPDSGNRNAIYLETSQQTIVRTIDGGATWGTISPPNLPTLSFALAPGRFGVAADGATLYAVVTPGSDVFVSKLDPSGKKLLYSTLIGSSSADAGTGIAVDAAGNAYVTGTAAASDFPITPGALTPSGPNGGAFVLKLNPQGDALIYSAIPIPTGGALPNAVAIDLEGNAYLTGVTGGGLTTTAGAYGTTPPGCGGLFVLTCGADGFATTLNAAGTELLYSTYLNHSVPELGSLADGGGKAIAVDPAGNAYITGASFIVKVNSTGSALPYSDQLAGTGQGITLDGEGNAYVTGGADSTFVATPGALRIGPANQSGAFVSKLDPNGSTIFAALLGGDSGKGIVLDPEGNIVIAGNTLSPNLPLRSPTQEAFNDRSGFLAKLNGDGSELLFSTYVGDIRGFQVSGLALDPNGDPIFCGSTGDAVFVAKYDLSGIPTVRLDGLANAASQLGVPVSSGEIISVTGSGFGSDARLLFDSWPALILSNTPERLTAIVPYALEGKTVAQVHVESGGQESNPVWVRIVPAAPGIYTADGSGTGQALALNEDGTRNSASNPAAPGSLITFYATGVGKTIPPGVDGVIHRSVPGVPILPFEMRVYDMYVSGPKASMGSVPGFAADVVAVQGRIPTPDFALPATGPVQITVNGYQSQDGVTIAIKQK